MNNKFKLPKIDILFQSITIVKQLVFPMLIIVINAIRVMPWWGSLAALVGLLGIIVLLAYISWRHFSYLFEADRIVIYSGIFSKKEKTIYYSRIHSVNISQSIFHRLFKLANLSIETPGAGGTGSDAEVRCLSIDKATYLQALLQHMGEASRNDEGQKQEQLLQSIVLNMKNSTSNDIIAVPTLQGENEEAGLAQLKQESPSLTTTETKDTVESTVKIKQSSDLKLTLDIGLMAKSALTSLNINMVIVWFAGIFAFADDIINVFFPDSTFIDDFFGQIEVSKSLVIMIAVLIVGVVVLTWFLSIIFYIIKFFDYKLERKGKQINVSYGLLNRQSIVFNETKVQSLIFEENPLRQFMGYGELKVNIVKSVQNENKVEDTYIVIHPFIHKSEVEHYIQHLMPKRAIEQHEHTESIPAQSLRTYLFAPVIVSLLPTVGTFYWLRWSSLWFLLLIVIVIGWRFIQFKTAKFSLDGSELKLVTRDFAKYTVYVKRQSLIELVEKASPYQRKKGLRKLSLKTLGGLRAKTYMLQGVSQEQFNRTKEWLQHYIKR